MNLGKLEVTYVRPDAVTVHPENPRRGDVDAIAESIDTNGLYRPVIVQESTGHILAGNHTYLAAVQHGEEEIPVVYLDVNTEQARRIMLADNRHADLGDYDDEMLAAVLNSLPDLEGTGYTDEDLQALLDAQEPEDIPAAFEEYGDDIPTEHECPSCGYRWSGSSAPKKDTAAPESEEDPSDA